MGHYGESHEGGRAYIADGMEVKKMNDIPMSAMWVQAPGVNKETKYGFNADDREVSVGRAYLRAEPGGSGVDEGDEKQRMGVVAPSAQADRGSGIGEWHQPLCDP